MRPQDLSRTPSRFGTVAALGSFPPLLDFAPVTFVITEPCVDSRDRSCVEVCPERCIYEALVIHPAECTDCTLCVDACPVEAIFPEAEVPSRWRAWIDRGYRAFGLEVPGRG